MTHGAPEPRRSSNLLAAAAAFGIVVAAALAAWGTFGGEEEYDFSDYWPVLIIVAVLAAVVFGLVVPWALRSGRAATAGLVLSVLGLLTVTVFWSGAPPIFAAAGIALGYLARQAALTRTSIATAAVVVGVLALVADLIIYITDMT